MTDIQFILGGARSGKSRFAEQLATQIKGEVIYIATAQALDHEMHDRIKKHKKDRLDKNWITVEEPIQLAKMMKIYDKVDNIILIDCLTLWMSNLIHQKKEGEIQLFLSQLQNKLSAHIIIVSNETGLGIVPKGKLSRCFIDKLGFLHQDVAALASKVYFCIAGIANQIK